VQWNGLTLTVPHNLIISTAVRKEVIPVFHQISWNELMIRRHLFLKANSLKVCSTPNKKDDKY
jgi:hypothetical protein